MKEDRILDAMMDNRFNKDCAILIAEARSNLRIASLLMIEAAQYLRASREADLGKKAYSLFDGVTDLYSEVEGRINNKKVKE